MCILLHEFPDAHRTYASQPFDIIAEPIVPVVLMVIRRADIDVAVAQFEEIDVPVCTENLNRVDEVKESPKLTE
jgi:hypothetical protein